MSKNYKIENKKYLKIDETSNGYEYSLYAKSKILLDGGIIEKQDLTEKQILKIVFKILGIPINTKYSKINEEIEETDIQSKEINERN